MLEHVFDAVLEGDCTGGTAGARSLHLDQHDAGILHEVYVRYIPAVFLHERPHTGLDDLFDKLDSFTIGIFDSEVVLLSLIREDWLTTCVVLRYHRQNLWLDKLPFKVFYLGH